MTRRRFLRPWFLGNSKIVPSAQIGREFAHLRLLCTSKIKLFFCHLVGRFVRTIAFTFRVVTIKKVLSKLLSHAEDTKLFFFRGSSSAKECSQLLPGKVNEINIKLSFGALSKKRKGVICIARLGESIPI